MLGEMINKHVEQYFKEGKDPEAFGKRLLRDDKLLAQIESFLQTQSMNTIKIQERVDEFGSTTIEQVLGSTQPWL